MDNRKSSTARRGLGLCLAALLAGAADARADGRETLIAPALDLTPRRVVAIQLEALGRNDDPYADAGIEQTWILAHPSNKHFTGPLSRFARMLKSPPFRAMLNHRSHTIELAEESDARVTFFVMIESATGSAVAYQWTVEKVNVGEDAGCWMTTGVSPPVPLGTII